MNKIHKLRYEKIGLTGIESILDKPTDIRFVFKETIESNNLANRQNGLLCELVTNRRRSVHSLFTYIWQQTGEIVNDVYRA